jgi:gliding motility-associatede transport system auxiliary component
MKRLSPYLGAAGLGFLAAGALLSVMQPARERVWVSFLAIGLVLLLFYLAHHWEEASRFAGQRSAREGANAVVLVAAVLGILVAINYLANRHAKRWDFTAARQYTLSDQTLKTLADLDQDVEIVLLDNPSSSRALAARDLLALYDDAGGRVRTTVVDPDADPEKALSYQDPGAPALTLGTVLVVAANRKERATAATEPEITNAILRVLRSGKKKIYFTSGHQEKSIDASDASSGLSVMKGKLEASTYEADTLVIARSAEGGKMKIPDDAGALVVAGPKTDFLPTEIAAIDEYLSAGGKAIFLIDPKTQGQTDSLCAFLRKKGAVVDDDVVVDPLSAPPLYPIVRSYGQHPIVESFSNGISVFPLVRSVARAEDAPEEVEVTPLFSSEAESWGETRLDELLARQGPAPDQKKGPLTLAVALSMKAKTDAKAPEAKTTQGEGGDTESPAPSARETRMVVVGDSDFIANELASAPVLNADLFLNMINWASQDESLISIRPREPQDRRIFLSSQQTTNILLLSLLIIPGAILVAGFSVWWGRR